MLYGLAIEIDASIERLHSVFAEIARISKAFFEIRQYGHDLLHIFVGVILTHPDSSRLHPVRKPNYKKFLKYKSPLTDEKIEMEGVFQYDLRLDYDVFLKLNAVEAGRMLCQLLVESTAVIQACNLSFPDFDVQAFKADLQFCLQGYARK